MVLKRIVVFIAIIGGIMISFSTTYAQNLMNNPESIVYDDLNDRYLVSNWGDGAIVAVDNEGNQTYFSTMFSRLAGLHIKDNVMYVATNLAPYTGVYGFDLSTDELVFTVDIPGSGLMNDIDTDTSGYLYITDYYDSKLYKIDIANQSYSLFVDHTLDWPNGIIFDKQNNRLLAASVNAAGRPLHAINLEDSTVSVAVYTNISNIDGLAYDSQGRLYLSSWWSDAIHRYNDPGLTDGPELFSSNHPDPADIYFDDAHDLLCIPIFYEHVIDYVMIDPNDIDYAAEPEKIFLVKNYPNPFNNSTSIEFAVRKPGRVVLDIFNLNGQKVTTLVDDFRDTGNHLVVWDAAQYSSGAYLYRLTAGHNVKSSKMILLK